MSEWQTSACILCTANCGIRVQLGGEDSRQIVRIKGDDAHPGSKGYLCNKASRLNYYQNRRDRLTSPMRRTANGTYEAVDWDTAISEIAQKLWAVKQTHGGNRIFYFGGGGQGNHSPGLYARSTLSTLGVQYRSNALAQEKTGEFWIADRIMGNWAHGDFEHCQVAIFLGKNPWHSHGVQRARIVLREIAKDPQRTLIVIDPKRTETADLADVHLAVRPGRDAWLLAALAGVLVQENLVDQDFLDRHVIGWTGLFDVLGQVPVDDYARISGVSEEDVIRTARLIGAADSVALFEDLGVQMNRHSTLVSYLQRLLWITTGNFGRPGTHYIPNGLGGIGEGGVRGESPVTRAPLLSGLVPCNLITDEILTDHPERFRAMIVESANPVHSLAGSDRFRTAMRSLDFSVVVDVAMTETAREADYVLPASSQYEKVEATFFNFEFPDNYFHLRQPLMPPLDGTLSEAEIHTRLARALGSIPEDLVERLDAALDQSRGAFARAVFSALSESPELMGVAPSVLYLTLGKRLAPGMEGAAGFWALAQQFSMSNAHTLHRAGLTGEGTDLGDRLFDAMVGNASGIVISSEDWDAVWGRLGNGGKFNLDLPEMIEETASLVSDTPVEATREYPFILSAGERRAFTANTIFRDPDWRRKDPAGALHMHPDDAARLNLADGSSARVTTRSGIADTLVELTNRMQPGHVSLPNGLGVDYPDEAGNPVRTGVAPNELTCVEDRDRFAGTPWHKSVPARVEPV